MKNLKKILIWFGICLVVVVAIKVGGFNPMTRTSSKTVLGAHVSNPGFGPLLEKR